MAALVAAGLAGMNEQLVATPPAIEDSGYNYAAPLPRALACLRPRTNGGQPRQGGCWAIHFVTGYYGDSRRWSLKATKTKSAPGERRYLLPPGLTKRGHSVASMACWVLHVLTV